MDTTGLLEHRDWVRALAYRLVKDQDVADDLVQEAWLAAERSRPIEPAAAKGWFASVLRRKVLERHRMDRHREDRESRVARAEGVASDERLHDQVDTERMLMGVIMELEEPHRRTLLLRYFEDRTPTEIAAMEGAPVRTVKSRLTRAHAALRERLDRRHGGQRREWLLALIPIARAPLGAKVASVGSSAGLLAAVAATLVIVGGGVLLATQAPEENPAELVDAAPRALPDVDAPALEVAAVSPPETAREALVVKAPAAARRPEYDRPFTLVIQAVEDATDKPVAGISGYVLDMDQRGEFGLLTSGSYSVVVRHGRRFSTDGLGRASMAVSGLGAEGIIVTDRWLGTFKSKGEPDGPITVRLRPNATMGVRVTDTLGEPMADVPVALGLDGARRTMGLVGSTGPKGRLKVLLAGEFLRTKAAAGDAVDLVATVAIPGVKGPLVPIPLDENGGLPSEPLDLVCPLLGIVQLDASTISPRLGEVALQTRVVSTTAFPEHRPERRALRLDDQKSASTRCGLGAELEALWIEDGKLRRMPFVGPVSSAQPVKVHLIADGSAEEAEAPAPKPASDVANNRVRVTGRLLRPNAEPAASEYASVRFGNTGQDISTDESGRFEFERSAMKEGDFPAKIRFALVKDPMMLHGDHEISALSGGSSLDVGDVFLNESPLLVEGTVRDVAGLPVPNAEVHMSAEFEGFGPKSDSLPPTWEPALELEVHSDEDGQFAIYAPDPSLYTHGFTTPTGRIQLSAKTERASCVPVISRRGEYVSLVVQRTVGVEFAVKGFEPELLRKAEVTLLQHATGQKFGCSRKRNLFWSVGLHPGMYAVEISHRLFEEPILVIDGVEVRVDRVLDARLSDVDISTLVDYHSVTVLSQSGDPAEDVTVWIKDEGNHKGAAGLVTDQNGTVQLIARRGVPREVQLGRLDFKGDYYRVDSDITLTLPQPVTLRVQLVGRRRKGGGTTSLTLRRLESNGRWSSRIPPTGDPDRDGWITFELDQLGEYQYAWATRTGLRGSRATIVQDKPAGTIQVLSDGTQIELTVPKDVLDKMGRR